MDVANTIAKKMATVQQLFRTAQAIVQEEKNIKRVVEQLEDYPREFVSIGYEAVAMELALRDLSEGNHLTIWRDFLEQYAQNHRVQVYVGLGWALGKQRLSVLKYIEGLDLERWRVFDGYGYYDGFFRKRSVLQGILPEGVLGNGAKLYVQGVGRSFWYSSKGNIPKLLKLIRMLPKEWQGDMWRGVGVACTYIGGGDATFWKELWEAARGYQSQLATGSAMTVASRTAANTLKEADISFFDYWSPQSATEIVQLLKRKKTAHAADGEEAYFTWMAALEQTFDDLAK